MGGPGAPQIEEHLELLIVLKGMLSWRTYRPLLNMYFLYIGAVTLAYGLLTAKVSRSWAIADWLINYQGGFVRRGLPGEIAYGLGHGLHVTPVLFAVLSYLSLYAVLFLCIRALALHCQPRLWVLAVLLSPATLAFQVLDPTAGFRKELIYLAAFALLAVLLSRAFHSATAMSVFISVTVVLAVLSHEALICFVPYFFALLVAGGRTLRQAILQMIAPCLLGGSAALACVHHLGDRATAAKICSSLGYSLQPQGSQICSGGAMSYLMVSRAMAQRQTAELVQHDHYVAIYAYCTLLAMLPLIAGGMRLAQRGFRRQVQVLWASAAVSFAGSLILFVYAQDWGRWIYIHVMSIGVVLLFLQGREQALERTSGEPEKMYPARRRVLAAAGLFAYATLWTLPHVPALTPRFGYLGLIRYVAQYKGKHPGTRL